MKRSAVVVADDGSAKVKIKILLDTGDTRFTRDEAKEMVVGIARSAAKCLEVVKYTDFGVENTKVEV